MAKRHPEILEGAASDLNLKLKMIEDTARSLRDRLVPVVRHKRH